MLLREHSSMRETSPSPLTCATGRESRRVLRGIGAAIGRARQDAGFTMIEMLVASTMALVVFAATLAALSAFQNNNHINQLRQETQSQARSGIDRLARELRNMIAATREPTGSLEQDEPFSLIFQTVNTSHGPAGKNTTDAMRVRYCLNDTNPTNEILWRQVERWEKSEAPPLPTATACPDTSATDWESSTQLVQHITNETGGQKRALFTYGPSSATEVAQIDAVASNLYLNLTPSRESSEIQLTSAVSLRNANRKPIAAFTATPVLGENKVKLDASESRDPDGLALTYKWWNGSELLPSSAQEFESTLTVGNHKIKLEVEDPAGLKSSAEKEVEVTA